MDSEGNVLVAGGSEGIRDFGGGDRPTAGGFDAFLAKLAPDGSHRYSFVFGDFDRQQASDVAVAPNGDALLVGGFARHIDLGGGELTVSGFDTDNFFLARFDEAGNPMWSQRIGGTMTSADGNLAATTDSGVVLCGSFDGTLELGDASYDADPYSEDILLASFGADGELRWSRRFGSESSDSCHGVAVNAPGEIAITGAFNDVVSFGGDALGVAGTRSVYVARYDSSGAHLASTSFPCDGLALGTDIAFAPSGRVVTTGWVNDSVLQFEFAAIAGPAGYVALL